MSECLIVVYLKVAGWKDKIGLTILQKLTVLVVILAKYVESENILIIIPFTSKSHYIMLSPIGLELARRGHNVTVITAITEKYPPPNYHEIVVDNREIWDVIGEKRPVVFDMVDKTFDEFLKDVLWKGGLGLSELVLKSSNLQDFLRKNNTFDLVFSEQFHQESLYLLSHKYKAPLVLASTLGVCMKHNIVVANPLQLNTILFEILTVKDATSFFGRLKNIYATAYDYLWWKYWYLGKQETLARKYIPGLETPVPSLYEVQKNTSLLLINTHFSFDTPMALLPNIIEIGGIHLSKSNTSLPKDLQKILDNAEHGVVYMNFGSNVKVSEMPAEKRDAFLNVFRNLKQTVLMKWEEDTIQNKPANVIIRKWFPQKEIFGHQNVKLFISHGGLISTQEATFNGIPILGVPVYADQYNNIDLVQRIGFGKIMEFKDINQDNVAKALNALLNDESYKRKAEEIAKRFKDRPMSPLDTSIWWFEYVMRNNGAHFMKNPARDIGWLKYYMIDMYIAIFIAIITILSLVLILQKCVRKILESQTKNNLKKKKL